MTAEGTPTVLPLIVVPGIMASRLYFPGCDKRWDPDATRRMAWEWGAAYNETVATQLDYRQHAEILYEKQAGYGRNNGAEQESKRWSGLPFGYYGACINALRSTNFGFSTPVYAFPYDWRRDNWAAAEQLADWVAQILDHHATATQVGLITHSMGGIVARAALKGFGPAFEKRVRFAIHVCQPALGAAVAYRRFFSGYDSWVDGFGMRFLFGDSDIEFGRVASGCPAGIQLLPTNHYPDPVDPRFSQDHYDEYCYLSTYHPPGVVHGELAGTPYEIELRKLTARAGEFHRWLGRHAHPNTAVIYGDARDTDKRVVFRGSDVDYSSAGIRPAEGDETVHRSSAQAMALVPPPRAELRVNVEHATAMNDGGVIAEVIRLVGAL